MEYSKARCIYDKKAFVTGPERVFQRGYKCSALAAAVLVRSDPKRAHVPRSVGVRFSFGKTKTGHLIPVFMAQPQAVVVRVFKKGLQQFG